MVLDRGPAERGGRVADGAPLELTGLDRWPLAVSERAGRALGREPHAAGPGRAADVDPARYEVDLDGLGVRLGVGRLEEEVEGREGLDPGVTEPEGLARLGPEVRRTLGVVDVGAGVGSPARPAGVELVDPGAALARLPGLAVERAGGSPPQRLVELGAAWVEARPQAGETSEEHVDTTRQESGRVGVLAGGGAERDEGRHSSLGGLLLGVWEDERAELADGERLAHRAVDEEAERRVRLQRTVEGFLYGQVCRDAASVEKRLDGITSGCRVGGVEGFEVEADEEVDGVGGPRGGGGAVVEGARDDVEAVGGEASEVGREGLRVLLLPERGRCEDDLEAGLVDAEPLLEATEEEGDLGPAGAAVEVGLVDDEQEPLVGVVGEPLAGALEDRALDGPHHHVLQHGVVGDEDVGGRRQHLVPGEELGVVGERDAAGGVAVGVGPATVVGTPPEVEVGLRGPLAAPTELVVEGLLGLVVLGVWVPGGTERVDVELLEGREPSLVFFGRADPGVEGPAGVAGEAGGPTGPPLEELADAGVAEEEPEAPELVVDERVHGVEQDGPDGVVLERGAVGRLARERTEDGHEEALRLARPRARRDDEAAPVAERLDECLSLMRERRVVEPAPEPFAVGADGLRRDRRDGALGRLGDVEVGEPAPGRVARGALEVGLLADDAGSL